MIYIFRIDEGKENIKIVRAQIALKGTGRNSVLAGRSVHNTRSERHWLEGKNRCTDWFLLTFW